MGNCCVKGKVSDDDTNPDAQRILVTPAPGRGTPSSVGYATSEADSEQVSVLKSSSAVKVAVMVRPMLEFERAKGCNDIVSPMPPTKVKLPAKPSGSINEGGYDFTFDRVYKADNHSAGKSLYEEVVTPVLDRYVQGFNATIAAYGQTGSGKTYTMGTAAPVKDVVSKNPEGVIPRCIKRIFDYKDSVAKTYDIILRISFVEIYNEAIQDLLPHSGAGPEGRPCSAGSMVSVREGPKGEVMLEGASEQTVSSREAVAHILDCGNANRAVASHKLNQESSRSHAILIVTLEQRARPGARVPAELQFLRSKLHLVDLAGSERAKETGTTGRQFAEGVNINKGLLELGNVINALTEGANRKHIPYRNSKLTRLLQDSLGGNSETLFIACVSPADANHDHTLGTLRYASRAMKIQNSLMLNNQISPEEEIAYLRKQVAELQAECAAMKAKMQKAGVT